MKHEKGVGCFVFWHRPKYSRRPRGGWPRASGSAAPLLCPRLQKSLMPASVFVDIMFHYVLYATTTC
eukprot:559375-Prymnesium_polylepis.1